MVLGASSAFRQEMLVLVPFVVFGTASSLDKLVCSISRKVTLCRLILAEILRGMIYL